MGLLANLIKYERNVSSRAWKDTWEYLPFTPKQAIFGIGTGAAAILLGLMFGQTETVKDGLIGACIVIAAWMLFYAWERTHAPFKLQNELSIENITLNKEIAALKEPGFDVEFSYSEDSFHHSGNTKFTDGEYGAFELYRIAVQNHHAPQQIQVRVVSIEGFDEFRDALPLPLQFQHDASASMREMSLTAGQKVFVDVVQLAGSTTKPFAVTIQSTVVGWRALAIRAKQFKMKLPAASCGVSQN